ncbi:hypothetical protein EMCRGX_G013033 [Ephydatia muelleri]
MSTFQRRLLAEPNLTFKKAQDIAQALESADRNTADLQQQVQAAVPVDALKKSQKLKNNRGSSTSTSKDRAPSKSSPTCYSKGKTGGNSKPPKGQNAKVVEAEEESFVINLSKVSGQKVDPFMVSVLVDGKALEMEVDTGASVSLISERTFKTHWRKEDKTSDKYVQNKGEEEWSKGVTFTGLPTLMLGTP